MMKGNDGIEVECHEIVGSAERDGALVGCVDMIGILKLVETRAHYCGDIADEGKVFGVSGDASWEARTT